VSGGIKRRVNIAIAAPAVAAYLLLCGGGLADDVNRTGQSQRTPGTDATAPGNPGEGDKPFLPGDQPAKQGTHPSSSVHNVDPKDLSGTKHKDAH